ncbi:hypothetical protein QQ045_004644 [Rhodiola kirilowii]
MSVSKLLILCIALICLVSVVYATDNSYDYTTISWTTNPACDGTVGECAAEDEFGIDSESNRRILASTQYISYGALNRNRVPCNQRGASYYNCQRGAQANPYTRGCSAITRCRR